MSPKATKATKAGKKAATKAPPPPKKVEQSESADDSEDESEEEVEPVKKIVAKKPVKVSKKAPPAPVEEESSDEDDEDDEEEEEIAAKPTKGSSIKMAPLAQPEDDDDDDDDLDDEDDDEDDDEEEEDAKEKNAKMAQEDEVDDESEDEVARMEEDDGDDDSEDAEEEEDEDGEEEEDDGEDDEDSDEDAKPAAGEKRKAKPDKKQKDAKKTKIDELATIFVGNVPDNVEESKIRKFFTKKGIEVGDIRLNERRPICHIDLNTSDLEKAVALSGQSLLGNELNIERATPKKKAEAGGREAKGGSDDSVTMFMKNLPYEATEKIVREVFPDVKEIRIPTREDGSARGFAFLEFDSPEEVESTIKSKQGVEIGGRPVFLDYVGTKSKQGTRNQGEAGKTKVLFVKNLSFNTEKDTLLDAFDGAASVRIATSQDTGRSRGFAFIEFDSAAEAKNAYESMQDCEIEGRKLVVDYASEQGGGRGGRGGFRGGWGGRGRGGGGGFGGGRGGRGGGYRGGRGGGHGGGYGGRRDGIKQFRGSRKTFD